MNAIYLINNRISINGLSVEDSTKLQEIAIEAYMNVHGITSVKLNPNQLNDYYTIPHALLYDLSKKRIEVDSLIIYSDYVLENFIDHYPARWLLLKSYFTEVVTVDLLKENIVSSDDEVFRNNEAL